MRAGKGPYAPALAALLVAIASVASVGCRRSAPARLAPAGLARCEAGLARIESARGSRDEAMSVLRRECAEVQTRAECRSAWTAASEQQGDRAVDLLVQGCAPAYCPALAGRGLALCADTALRGVARDRAWADLQHAIWELELGPRVAGLEKRLMLAFTQAAEAWEDEATDGGSPR